MRKILLALTFGISTVAFAQNDISVTLTSPANGSTITKGTAFNFDVTIANTGTVDIDVMDSVIFGPMINGQVVQSLVSYTLQGIPVGQSITLSQSLVNNGGTSGQLNFCALAVVIGNGWTGVVESDTANNRSCNTVNYDAGGTVGINEFIKVNPSDDSYYANGTYFVRMSNQAVVSAPTLVVYNIAGVEVFRSELNGNGSAIDQDVAINGLSKGIYVVEVQGLSDKSVKKIVVQ